MQGNITINYKRLHYTPAADGMQEQQTQKVDLIPCVSFLQQNEIIK